MAKITLTKAEANEIIRKHFGVGSDLEIEISEDAEIAKDVNRHGWVSVPSDWNKTIAPDEAMWFDYIEVQTRDGVTERGKPTDYTLMWYQEDHPMDIVRYRGIESL